jgi:hypothetical protein
MSANTKVTKTKTALKQETYNLSDLKHDPHCGFVELELGDLASVALGGANTIVDLIGSNNSKFITVAPSRSSSLLIMIWAPSFSVLACAQALERFSAWRS